MADQPSASASLREIEDEVHRKMSRLEAQVIQDTAQQSPSQAWSGASGQERPICPVCGTPLQARGKRPRQLQAVGGQTITLKRDYGSCPTCGAGLFALDEELGLLPGSLSPQAQDYLSRLAVWMPFAHAAEMLAVLTGVQVSEATTRRHTYAAGVAYEAVQAAQALRPEDWGGGPPADKLVRSRGWSHGAPGAGAVGGGQNAGHRRGGPRAASARSALSAPVLFFADERSQPLC